MPYICSLTENKDPKVLKKLAVNISKYFFLFLFIGFFVSITAFTHVHIVDGIKIVHSHPYSHDKSGKPLHEHNGDSYLLITLLDNFIAAGFILSINLCGPWPVKTELKFIRIRSLYHRITSFSDPLRGPPAMPAF